MRFILSVFSLLTLSCTINRAQSENMLNTRSDYLSDKPLDVDFIPTEQKTLPTRAAAVTADIWVHPNEMGPHDYFLGGWIRSVIKEPHWSTSPSLEKAYKASTKSDPAPKKEATFSNSRRNQ